MPSDHENFGMAVIEALASGTPVIISNQVNIHEEVTAAGVGAVVSTDPETLASQIASWLSNEDHRRSAAARCRPFAFTNYDWRHIAQGGSDTIRRSFAWATPATGAIRRLIRRSGNVHMRIVVCWSDISGYMAACWGVLSPGVKR